MVEGVVILSVSSLEDIPKKKNTAVASLLDD